MNIPVYKNEDKRRTLIEWIADYPITTCKVLIAKEDCELGNHYHNKKIDTFFLLKGSGTFRIGEQKGVLFEGSCYRALAKEPHTFYLKAGSILLEASTTPYDKEDEIQVTE
jgi:mannose-6-phosphate isomerase-like protein (cupin superfamily)